MTTDDTGKPVLWWLDIYLRNESHVQKNLEFLLDGSLLSPTGGVKGMNPCTSYSRTFTIHNYGYVNAYTFTHNNITLEHTAMNDKNTITHTDAYNTQY